MTSFCHKPGGRGPFRMEALRGSNCSAPPASAATKFPFIKTSTSGFCVFLGSLLSEIRTFHPSISTSPRSRQMRLRTFSLCSDQLFLGFGVAAAAGSCAGTHSLETQESERRQTGRWIVSAKLQSRQTDTNEMVIRTFWTCPFGHAELNRRPDESEHR